MHGGIRGAVSAAVLGAVATLAACTVAPPSVPVETRSAAPSAQPRAVEPSAAPTPAVSERGFTVTRVGEPFVVPDEAGEPLATFTVTALTVDPPCSAPAASAPRNGHFVRVDLSAQTSDSFTMGDVALREGMFRVVDDAGFTFDGMIATPEAFTCLPPDEQFPLVLTPGASIAGALVVDVPSASGILIADGFTRGGWEWTYPEG